MIVDIFNKYFMGHILFVFLYVFLGCLVPWFVGDDDNNIFTKYF